MSRTVQRSLRQGPSGRGGRLRRAQRSAAGSLGMLSLAELHDAGRSAFVTPQAMSAPCASSWPLGVWEVAGSSALPPSEDGGAGRKNGVGSATTSRREGDHRVAASLRAGHPAACLLPPGAQAPAERGQRARAFLYDGPTKLAARGFDPS